MRRKRAEPEIPEGQRLYVVGDVHGRADLLEAMARLIEADARDSAADAVTVLLGDYIDRGPQSAEVINRLSEGALPTPVLALCGNHEATMLKALEDPTTFREWWRFGGLETLISYGVDISEVRHERAYREAQARLLEHMPQRHLEFLQGLRRFHEVGDYFFSHAGVRPNVPLSKQVEADLLWIRGDFLKSRVDFGKKVVHGHTPVREPDFRPNRINVDTGAYITGRLTCVVLEGAGSRVLST